MLIVLLIKKNQLHDFDASTIKDRFKNCELPSLGLKKAAPFIFNFF